MDSRLFSGIPVEVNETLPVPADRADAFPRFIFEPESTVAMMDISGESIIGWVEYSAPISANGEVQKIVASKELFEKLKETTS